MRIGAPGATSAAIADEANVTALAILAAEAKAAIAALLFIKRLPYPGLVVNFRLLKAHAKSAC
ncbi:Hypothetical protein CpCap5W_1014 [Corynebacterium pseudotuberculosis]|nr:Hypothetical protein Cp3995_1694 [Corynebacterium pseudotuberculosis 3/99-5]AIG05851.1 hypothetical protein CPTA_00022 [Corynebacterium pseudotuberculosis]AIG09561.1 hypothetical protein CPTB_01505 [Corynebacterium pseudotuberculosis]AIG10294.1 hypothetical protein CPTC_00006 [Corynebacterium pseudotuberculosis]AKC74420.1 Hypothetical protein Cp226_1716 [Corynebacterium pseudotuberculosis]